jgi:hypothetical protein
MNWLSHVPLLSLLPATLQPRPYERRSDFEIVVTFALLVFLLTVIYPSSPAWSLLACLFLILRLLRSYRLAAVADERRLFSLFFQSLDSKESFGAFLRHTVSQSPAHVLSVERLLRALGESGAPPLTTPFTGGSPVGSASGGDSALHFFSSSWLYFPHIDRVSVLNRFLVRLWPALSPVLSALIRSHFNAKQRDVALRTARKEIKAKPFVFECKSFDLRWLAPRLEGVQLYHDEQEEWNDTIRRLRELHALQINHKHSATATTAAAIPEDRELQPQSLTTMKMVQA